MTTTLKLAGSLAVAVILAGATPASAAPDETTAGELSAQAIEHFDAKEFDEAIGLFEQAYEKDPQPNYLFNIGRVYEEKGDFESAVARYQDFISKPGVDLEARQNAVERIKVLRGALEQMNQSAAPEPAPAPAPAPESDTVPAPVPEPKPAGLEDTTRADRIRKLRITGYSLLGVGGASLIVGGVFGGMALGKSNDAKDAMFVDEAMGLRNDARQQARVADAMYITGGVLAGAGLVMVLATLGKKNRRRTAVAPSFGGVVLSHRY